MLKVGLTGGIGSGKTTVARIFEILGVPVYYADEQARQLIDTDPEIRKALVAVFGEKAYGTDGLNRSFIASLVFNDPAKLALLNSITHPPVIRHSNEWVEQQEKQAHPLAIKEAALFFESGSVRYLDFVIGVSAPLSLRIKRVMDRDGTDARSIQSRIERQLDESIKLKLCDAVIVNDEQSMLIPQVLKLHQELLAR